MFVLYCTCVSVFVSVFLCILYLDGNSVVSCSYYVLLFFSSVVFDNLQPFLPTTYLLPLLRHLSPSTRSRPRSKY
jgi:hypothetical protein